MGFIVGHQKLAVKVRFDDACKNGHKTFSMVYVLCERASECGIWTDSSSGPIKLELTEKFCPHLSKYVKWHSCTTDGPLHYLSNSLYAAGDKDCWGLRKGEPSRSRDEVRFHNMPIGVNIKNKKFLEFLRKTDKPLKVQEVPHPTLSPNYTVEGLEVAWHYCQFTDRAAAEGFVKMWNDESVPREIVSVPVEFSKGKEPELGLARVHAIWPDAELEDFTKEKLLARLPKLLQEFRADMEELGFEWES